MLETFMLLAEERVNDPSNNHYQGGSGGGLLQKTVG